MKQLLIYILKRQAYFHVIPEGGVNPFSANWVTVLHLLTDRTSKNLTGLLSASIRRILSRRATTMTSQGVFI